MLELKWTPDTQTTTLVRGSRWRRKRDGKVCVLCIDDRPDFRHSPWFLIHEHIFIEKFCGEENMLAWLARDFEPLDPPKDNRTVGELEAGECFVGESSEYAWMRTDTVDAAGVKCVSLDIGTLCWFSLGTVPTRILGKINPESIVAIIREAGGGA